VKSNRSLSDAINPGWDRWLGPRGAFIGMHSYGAPAPGEAPFPHFGITAENSPKPPAPRCNRPARDAVNSRIPQKTVVHLN
jgi:hypothetical protein